MKRIPILLIDEQTRFLHMTYRLLLDYYRDELAILATWSGDPTTTHQVSHLTPRVILLDVDTATISAYAQQITQLHSLFPNTPIILIGSRECESAHHQACATGADGFIARSALGRDLLSVIWYVLLKASRGHRDDDRARTWPKEQEFGSDERRLWRTSPTETMNNRWSLRISVEMPTPSEGNMVPECIALR